jgi:hypothetical protein
MSNSIQIQASAEPAGNPGEIQWNDNGDFGASSSLFWDNANERLGIGTNTPTEKLTVAGGLEVIENIQSQSIINVTALNGIANIRSIGGDVRLTAGPARSVVWNGNTQSFFRAANNVADLGNSSNNWRDLFLGRNAYIGGDVGIGTTTPQARLDVKAQGALSTDIALRVRNSADTFDSLSFTGNNQLIIRQNVSSVTSTESFAIIGNNVNTIIEAKGWATSGSQVKGFFASATNQGNSIFCGIDAGGVKGLSASAFIENSLGRTNFGNAGNNANGWAFLKRTASTYSLANTVFAIYPTNAQAGGGTLALGTTLGTTLTNIPSLTYGKNTFFIANGTAPTTTGADAFGIYSADITAGNAAPHFRTENGDVVKLYAEADAAVSFSANTGDANTDAMINFLMSHLKNMGIVKEL